MFNISLDKEAVKELADNLRGNVTVAAKAVTKLTGDARDVIGSRPVYEFTLSDTKGKKGDNPVGDGNVSYSIPYELGTGEAAGNLYIAKVVNGQVIKVEARYDNGWITWTGDGNGVYGVGCNE